METPKTQVYKPRHIDSILDQVGSELPAILLDGPKGVGKTSTALRRAKTIKRLDDPRDQERLRADLDWVTRGERPILIDEWQKSPEVWETVKRSVDEDSRGGGFLLTGSLPPASTHSGALRITSLRMRPMTLAERGEQTPPISFADLLDEKSPDVDFESAWTLTNYIDEITRSGFPAIRGMSHLARSLALEGYIQRVIDSDLPEIGQNIRRPEAVMAWMSSYAAATATTASWESIRDGANSGSSTTPTKVTTIPYRDALTRLRILDELPAWLPSQNFVSRLSQGPKHFLADPALAVSLLGLNPKSLEVADTPGQNAVKPILGRLFEALATLSIRVYAEANNAKIYHFRDGHGRREVDLIVIREDGKVLPIEIKMTSAPKPKDSENLRWLKTQLGDKVLEPVLIHTGKYAYKSDGVLHIPLALLTA